MIKKILLVLIITMLVTGSVFAQSIFSIGGGLMLEGGDIGFADKTITINNPWGDSHNTQEDSISLYGFGVWAFVDATLLEFSIGLLAGSSRWRLDDSYDLDLSGTFIALDISLLGKLPFFFGSFDIFPLFGIGYNMVLSAKLENDSYDWPEYLSTFRLIAGIGSDIDLRSNLFIRASILGSYRFPSQFFDNAPYSNQSAGFGVTAKAGIGYRL